MHSTDNIVVMGTRHFQPYYRAISHGSQPSCFAKPDSSSKDALPDSSNRLQGQLCHLMTA